MSQPMDQGVRRCLKAHYRKRLVKLILRSLDSNKSLPKVSLLTALQLLVSAWNEVSQTTIVNCLIHRFDTLLTRESRKVQASKNYELFCKRNINLHCHTLIFFMFIVSFTQTGLGFLEAFS